MVDFLITPTFKYAVLPIGSAIVGVAVKYTSRNDQYSKFTKEDLAVGLDLALTACLMFVVLTTDRASALIHCNKKLADVLAHQPIDAALAVKLQTEAQLLSGQIASSGWLIFMMFMGLASVATIVRKWGWTSATEMRTGVGITLPLVFGVLTIIAVMAGAIK